MQLQLEMERAFGKLSDEQFYQFCLANKGRLRLERDENGQIILMPPTGLETGSHNAGLSAEFTLWNRESRLGKVFGTDTGFTLPDSSVKSPDVAWMSLPKWNGIPDEERRRFAHVVPDFVLELRSASDELGELQRKMEKWLENGVRLAWLLDTGRAVTYVYRPGQQPESVAFAATLTGQDVLPGFTLNLEQFMDNIA